MVCKKDLEHFYSKPAFKYIYAYVYIDYLHVIKLFYNIKNFV